jgi:hypothetical protein
MNIHAMVLCSRFVYAWPVVLAMTRLTLKAIDDELRRLGHDVHLEKGDGYFYFWKGAANNRLDRTVNVPKVSSLTLAQWIDEFNRLKKLNGEMLSGKVPKKTGVMPRLTSRKPPKSRK